MNRNVESHFAELPKIDIERSTFDLSKGYLTSFNIADLIPFYLQEVVPGDTFNVKTSCVVRLQTPLTPIFSNIYLDTYYFFVPLRLVWQNFKKFMGESDTNPWLSGYTGTVPEIYTPSGGWSVGSLADYFGIPPAVDISSNANSHSISHLPFRCYCAIVNEWFRDQNLSYACLFNLNDTTTLGSNHVSGQNYITEIAKGAYPYKVCKYHDYFTSCLPNVQRAYDPVGLWANSLGDTTFERLVPVYTTANKTHNSYGNPLELINTNGVSRYLKYESQDDDTLKWKSSTGTTYVDPTNLWANVGQMQLSINELRLAFQLQKYYEKIARGGSRYREQLKVLYGVTSSDARMQIPEYLGGHRFPLSIHQVENNSEASGSFLGDLGAMSNTSDIHEDFIKSFEEHGYVIGVCCARYDRNYSQGIERTWLRKSREEFYTPVFANIGEQPVYLDEIYAAPGQKDTVFGYQEAWADYRYGRSLCTGQLRPGISGSLASWHLGDYYTTAPTLSDDWIREDPSNVDRVLSVQSSVANQVMADFYIQNIATRPMPLYSIPGLVDHH